jgi:1,2-phenylacetyl-CoA epoxidase PaaB subunit
MTRYEAVIKNKGGREFTRFPVHADSEPEALEQARSVFLIMHADLMITDYRFTVTERPRS